MSGVDRPDDIARVKSWVAPLFVENKNATILVHNDAVAVLAGGFAFQITNICFCLFDDYFI
jgi:hypothetical protein